MNTTEHIVELYYRFVKKCFTISDVKIPFGNNRQIDILALKLENGKPQLFHVEVGVSHIIDSSQEDLSKLKARIEYKFFGSPRKNDNESKHTDYYKNKSYKKHIEKTYLQYGFKFEEIKRVYCLWYRNFTNDEYENWRQDFSKEFGIDKNNIEILSFREDVIPEIVKIVKSNYYDDELLRILSLLKQCDLRKEKKIKQLNANSKIVKFFGKISDDLQGEDIDKYIYEN